ncbi:hypothetical protein GIB67_016560 [Kingdonia uniflora]|uniref:RNA-binding protein 25 n=1 Tax=Kingdonia uniflora TaxID=39325 RepID=A0A7J7NQR2_9MAGN|nr:hypothetical protein GIB67_016560 [Kingdonia uniflora]
MAVSPSPNPETLESKSDNSESSKPILQDPPSAALSSSSSPPASKSENSITENPNLNPPILTPPPPSIQSFAPSAPSFRPLAPQFSPYPNPNYQTPNVQSSHLQPPGVNPVSIMLQGAPTGVGAVTVSMSGMPMYPGQPPNPAMMRGYAPMPNGYSQVPMPNQGLIPPPGGFSFHLSLALCISVLVLSVLIDHGTVRKRLGGFLLRFLKDVLLRPHMLLKLCSVNALCAFVPRYREFRVAQVHYLLLGVQEDLQGIPPYPTQYTSMVRPSFPPRPPGTIGMLPPLLRPPVPGIHGVPPLVRPVVPIVAPTEKPQTTVYVGKISPTVENDFMLSLLRLCGPVKSWKRAQDPSDGTPRGFGFCEFESAEGVLRALRLLSKFSVDGQELVLNVNQATREYLERYVEKKTEREKFRETEVSDKEEEGAPGVEKSEPLKPSKPVEESKEMNGSADKETQGSTQNFGIVTNEDRDADRDALEKLKKMLEERLKTKPLPPPPPQLPVDGSAKLNSEIPTKSRDGGDSDVDVMKSDAAEDKNDDETSSEKKVTAEHETSSPDRNGKYDRSRERDKERDLKRVKERELERYERERERERLRRERDRETKIWEAERMYKERVKEWESREREKEYQRQSDRDREKERERERKREIADQEDDNEDDGTRKRRRRSSALEEKRKKRYREKEDDLDDRLREEEEEIVDAKRRAIEEEELEQQKQRQRQQQQQQQKEDEVKRISDEKTLLLEEANAQSRAGASEQSYESDSGIHDHADDVVMKDISGDGSSMLLDTRPNSNNASNFKLGFGLAGTGKRATVLSVFHEEDDDEANKNIKMKPLVPIDYSTEEIQAVQPTVSGAPPPTNLAAAAEFAKRISTAQPKEDRSNLERERNRRPSERSSHRDRNDEESNHSREDNRERNDRDRDRDRGRERGSDKLKTSENKKLLDAKQLIDMIPKTKEELFSYKINWPVYDEHKLHDRMKPWIAKKITEFLGEEEATLVDYIVSSTKEHVRASRMLELLQTILDDEAEMFVLKMWRMLIFEIKKVETGLSLKPTV